MMFGCKFTDVLEIAYWLSLPNYDYARQSRETTSRPCRIHRLATLPKLEAYAATKKRS